MPAVCMMQAAGILLSVLLWRLQYKAMDLSRVDWITVNETECCQLTGCTDTMTAYEALRGTGLVPCSFCHFILACSSTYWRTARQSRRYRHGRFFTNFLQNAEQSSIPSRLII